MKNLAKLLFKSRSYTPIPFLLLMLIFYSGNIYSWLIGIPIIFLGEFIRLWGVAHAGSITRTTTSVKANILVTSGPFAHVRNPLYIGNIISYMGFGILSLALFPYLQIAAFIWFVFQYTLIISIEEEFLESKFGVSYEDYKTQVNRLWPRLTPYKAGESLNIQPDFRKGLKSESRTIQAIFGIIFFSIIVHLVK